MLSKNDEMIFNNIWRKEQQRNEKEKEEIRRGLSLKRLFGGERKEHQVKQRTIDKRFSDKKEKLFNNNDHLERSI